MCNNLIFVKALYIATLRWTYFHNPIRTFLGGNVCTSTASGIVLHCIEVSLSTALYCRTYTLTITNYDSVRDDGTYVCRAENIAGTDVAAVAITTSKFSKYIHSHRGVCSEPTQKTHVDCCVLSTAGIDFFLSCCFHLDSLLSSLNHSFTFVFTHKG